MKIRHATAADTLQLTELMRQYIVDFYKRPHPVEGQVETLIHKLQTGEIHGIQLVAVEEEQLLGFATLYFSFSTLQLKQVAILNDLFVLPTARGKGIGEQLFQACLSYMREHDFAYMTWETAKDNHVAQALYRKLGGVTSDWLVYEIK